VEVLAALLFAKTLTYLTTDRPSSRAERAQPDHRILRIHKQKVIAFQFHLSVSHEGHSFHFALTTSSALRPSSINSYNSRMVEYMTISSRFSSWRDYQHLSKKKGTKGFPKKSVENEGLLAPSFMKVINSFEGESFLLLPTGGNQVSISIHNCFTLVEDGTGTSVFGILGSAGLASTSLSSKRY
jgi:hypothetical protein